MRDLRIAVGKSGSGFDVRLPRSLKAERHGDVAVLLLARPEKRNAIDDPTVFGIEAFFAAVPDGIKAVVLAGEGDHFCSGLDLGELSARDVSQGIAHSRSWHRAFEHIEFGKVPVVAVLHGAVVGGGLELAAAAHVRVAERSAYYALPEGSRGIFLGGGGSVRLPRLIGVARMMDMMLTGRVYSATEGASYGFAQYVTDAGNGLAKALELATKIASNAPLTNFAVLQALPMIAEANPQTGLLMESLMATVAQSDKEAKRRIREFLEHKTAKVKPKS
jgi:(methylthio)acryloyl-CoA hydratase